MVYANEEDVTDVQDEMKVESTDVTAPQVVSVPMNSITIDTVPCRYEEFCA